VSVSGRRRIEAAAAVGNDERERPVLVPQDDVYRRGARVLDDIVESATLTATMLR